MATGTKNSMPSFAQGSYENIQKLIADEKINAPAFIYFTDRECLGFLDHKKDLHVILWDKVNEIEKLMDGLVDEETQQPIKVTDYVEQSVLPVQDKVDLVDSQVSDIQQNGAAIMLVSGGVDDGE